MLALLERLDARCRAFREQIREWHASSSCLCVFAPICWFVFVWMVMAMCRLIKSNQTHGSRQGWPRRPMLLPLPPPPPPLQPPLRLSPTRSKRGEQPPQHQHQHQQGRWRWPTRLRRRPREPTVRKNRQKGCLNKAIDFGRRSISSILISLMGVCIIYLHTYCMLLLPTGLIPTLAAVEGGLRGAWDVYGTLVRSLVFAF